MRRFTFLLFTASGLAISFLGAQEGVTARVAFMKTTPKIDGVLDRGEWSDALAVAGLVSDEGVLTNRGARVWIGLTNDDVCFAMESDLPPGGDILARISERPKDETATLYSDDVAEFWLSPISKSVAAEAISFRLATNALGSLYVSRHDPMADQGFGAWAVSPRIAHKRDHGKWVTELAIPIKSLNVAAVDLAGMRFRAARNWKQPVETASTEGWGKASFANADSMSSLFFDPEAPTVQELSLGDWAERKLDWQYSLKNTADHVREVRVNLDIASNSSMPPKTVEKVVVLKPGDVAGVDLSADLVPDVACQAQARISSLDGKTTYFSRTLQINTRERKQVWQLEGTERAPETEFFIAYSPSRNEVAFKLTGPDVSRERLSIRCEVVEKGDGRVIAQQTFYNPVISVDRTAVFGAMSIPDLANGSYEMRCQIVEPGAEDRIFKRPFERTHYPWEKTTLGKEAGLPYGFPAVRVEGVTVKTSLTEYQLGDTGLPSQIKAEGVPLLVGPIEIRGRVKGQEEKAKGEQLTINTVSQEDVQARAKWTLGAVSGDISVEADADGFLSYVLKVVPALVSLSELEVEIPLASKEVTLLHSVGAGVRGNYAGKMPLGEGEVWNNLQAVAYGYPDNFIPYVWLGGIRRGLAFVADSSTGWAIRKDEASLRIVRDGETIRVVARIVSRPTSLDKGMEVKFSLQATPVKNRPVDWRRYDFVDQFPGITSIRYLGSCPYWGGISAFGDFYPRGYDYSIFKEQQEATQAKRVTPAMQEYIEEWNKGNASFTNFEGLDDHVERGFARASMADYVVPYTDAREIRESTPEFRVFQDEWVRRGFNAREWSDENTACVTTEAVSSFQDFALWHFQKMKEVGNLRGIYFDNDFPIIQKNPFFEYAVAAGGGGSPRPSTGIYDVREYLKRAYKVFSENGAMPLNTVHMTNSALAPHLAFATVSLDWEFKYGAADFQDRFSQDYIFASTMGEQFGTIPLVLSGIFPTKEKSLSWMTRTLIGSTFVYEVKIYGSSELDRVLYRKIFNIIYGFGYGTKACEVYRFWENPPFRVEGSGRAILLRNGGRLLLMITDFGEGGECVVQFDPNLRMDGLVASDAESGERLNLQESRLKLDLARHDFKIVLFDSTER